MKISHNFTKNNIFIEVLQWPNLDTQMFGFFYKKSITIGFSFRTIGVWNIKYKTTKI